MAAARSWFAGKSVGVILLILGALCVLAAGAIFIAVTWTLLPLAIRALILIVITAGFALLTQLALRRGLQANCGVNVGDCLRHVRPRPGRGAQSGPARTRGPGHGAI